MRRRHAWVDGMSARGKVSVGHPLERTGRVVAGTTGTTGERGQRATDGPFAEAKEVLGGYWMIDVKSREEAIEWAKRCPASPNEMIEVRQVQEMADFPADVQQAAAGFAEMHQQQSVQLPIQLFAPARGVPTGVPAPPHLDTMAGR